VLSVVVSPEEIFNRFFWPLYPPDVRTRADLERARVADANPGRNPNIVAHLDDAAARFVHNARDLFGIDLGLDGSDASVHRLSAALTEERRDAWASRGAAGSTDNALFNAAIHGAAYVGSCILKRHDGSAWSVRRPLWESVVRLRSPFGVADLAVFHWWLKSLAGNAQAATLADRYRTHVEVPCARPEERPIIVQGDRALPRLKDPHYDRLHQYLRAHLPEVRSLGPDFPSPERFEAFTLRWIDFHVVGSGRMVLMACASGKGCHLFWLSASGFEKALFFPCDSFPDPVVRVVGDRVVVLARERGLERSREMLWWGP
jgi:hypothetical protein